MTQCNSKLLFPFFKSSNLTVTFNGGEITTDGGLLLVREFDEHLQFTQGLSDLIPDPRSPFFIQHPQEELLRQRLYQIIAGYEDCNDATRLRHDAVFKAIAGRKPEDAPIASQPTLCRFENRCEPGLCWELAEYFVRTFIATREEPPAQITLEMDPSDIPTYGHQQLTFFHGFYEQHMYFPMFLCDADSGFLLAPLLRKGNSGATDGIFRVLPRVVEMLRHAWPDLRIDVRLDSSFATPEILVWLEQVGLPYAIGIGPNKVLERLSAPFVERVQADFQRTFKPQRRFTTLRYAAETWDHKRRIIVKCEVTSMGTNVRYVIVTRRGRSADLYDWYVKRGGTIENYIKELKNGFEGDRLSCESFMANQFRLVLHTAAYNLMLLFREHSPDPEVQHAQIQTLRIKLLKVGGRVRQTARRIWIDLSSSWPFRDLFHSVHATLVPGRGG